jgi:UDP-2-acetamido-2,6-beta-L-arabino-hexul-4-ose reductase
MKMTHVIEVLKVREDERGKLFECVRDIPEGAQAYVFTVNRDQERGKHWHRRKTEWFICLSGSCTLMLEGSEGKDPAENVAMHHATPTCVKVLPGTKHTFRSPYGATILAVISESFDSGDPDTFYSEIQQ